MSKLKEIKELRAREHSQMVELLKKEQTSETRAAVAKHLEVIDALGTDITNIERADSLAQELAVSNGTVAAPVKRSAEEVKAAYKEAFFENLRFGNPGNKWQKGQSEDSSKLLHEARQAFNKSADAEQRDQQAGTFGFTYTQGAAGGYFVPAGFVQDVDVATKYFAPLLNNVRVLDTATGQPLPYPTANDTNNAWSIIGEAVQVNDVGQTPNYATQGSAPTGQPGNVGLGHVIFGAWKGTTGLVRVSIELLQDSAFNLEAFLKEAFSVRLGRGYEYYLTSGSGTSQPLGIIPAIAASGAVAVTATGSSTNDGSSATGANSIGTNDLVFLEHSVDPTYRRGAKFMLHDTSVRQLKTLLDKFGRPIWLPGASVNAPDTILGYQYIVNQSFPVVAAGATTVAFGAWDKFICRRVKDLQVLRLDERFADFGEVAFVGFSRIDSNLIDAGTHPLNVLKQHT